MRFTQLFPVLATRDLPRLVHFYIHALDAVVTYEFAPDGVPGYVALDLAGGHLGIGLDSSAPEAESQQRAALWFYTDDCDAAVHRLEEAGASVVSPPADMPWGERVATVSDPDGNVVHLGRAAVSG